MRKMAMALLVAAAGVLSLAAVDVWAQVFGVHEPGSVYFSDVVAGSAGDEHIGWLAEAEITGGFPDGTYRPNDFVTREQMAIYLARQRAVSTVDTLLVCDLMFGGTAWGTLFGTPGGLTQAEQDANMTQMVHAIAQVVAMGENEITLPYINGEGNGWDNIIVNLTP